MLFQILKLKPPTCFPIFSRESLDRQRSSRVHWVLEQKDGDGLSLPKDFVFVFVFFLRDRRLST